MKFQIVSDSSFDLPKERTQELGVDIVPFYVSFEEENYMKAVSYTHLSLPVN